MKPSTAAARAESESLVIGVDGGGTKTEAALARMDSGGHPQILARCTAGPGNLQSPSFCDVTDQVKQAVDDVLGQRPERSEVVAVAFCMAGAGNEPLRQRFEQWVRDQQLAQRSMVTHDARALIEAGTPQGHGVALIAGTGSLAYARTPAGREARSGGWGSLVGDEGSAHWLTLEALRAACRAADLRGPQTLLTAALDQWLGGSDPRQWPAKLRTLQPGAIAAAAPLISDAAAEGDAVALELIERCGDQLSRLIVNLAERCFAGEPIDLALAGGLILHNATLRQTVLDNVNRAGIVIRHCRDVRHPVEGAVRLAARMVAGAASR